MTAWSNRNIYTELQINPKEWNKGKKRYIFGSWMSDLGSKQVCMYSAETPDELFLKEIEMTGSKALIFLVCQERETKFEG